MAKCIHHLLSAAVSVIFIIFFVVVIAQDIGTESD